MTTPLLSFAYPVHNRAALFARTLDTFVCQVDPPPYEILVLDDGSTDDLFSLVRYYGAEAPARFRLPLRYFRLDVTHFTLPYWQTDDGGNGAGLAWNVGIRQARGERVVLSSPEIVLRSAENLRAMAEHVRAEREYVPQHHSIAGVLRTGERRCAPTAAIIADVYDRTWRDTFAGGWIGGGEAQRPFHFLAAYDRERLTSLGGFDERFMAGRAFDDDELVARWTASGGTFVFTGGAVVAEHLPHDRAPEGPADQSNRALFEQVKGQTVANQGHEWGSVAVIVETWEP